MTTKKRTLEEWREALAEQQSSGLTQVDWCKRQGINIYTFRDRTSHQKRLAREEATQIGSRPPVTVDWLEIKPEIAAANPTGIIVEHGGFRVTVKTGFDVDLLTEVLRAVKQVCF